VPEDLLSLEQPATPATAIVAAPMAINNSRFTEFHLRVVTSDLRGLAQSEDKLVVVEANAVNRLFSVWGKAFHFPAGLRGDMAEIGCFTDLPEVFLVRRKGAALLGGEDGAI
jgi:hypothetical protein